LEHAYFCALKTKLNGVLNTTELLVKKEIASTKAFVLYRLENKVLFFDYHNNITIELEDVKEAFELYVEHSEEYTYKVMLVFGKFSSITSEARKYAENKRMPTPAQAVIIQNLAQRMFARFYKMFRKDSHPLQFFGSLDEALPWLEEQA